MHEEAHFSLYLVSAFSIVLVMMCRIFKANAGCICYWFSESMITLNIMWKIRICVLRSSVSILQHFKMRHNRSTVCMKARELCYIYLLYFKIVYTCVLCSFHCFKQWTILCYWHKCKQRRNSEVQHLLLSFKLPRSSTF